MGSRDKDHSTPHQPLLSSLVVRPTDSGGAAGGGGGGGGATGAGGPGSDYEPGEVRRDAAPGYRLRTGSVSPVHHRSGNRYSPGFDHSGAPPRSRNYGSGRDQNRYQDNSPPHGRERNGSRFNSRGFDGPGHGPGPFRGEAAPRNNPNVRPREGDWICSDPACNNLNFARREICNNCKKPRNATTRSPPRRGYPAPPPLPPRRFPGPPDRSPGRMMNGYRSPPRGWARDDPRDFRGVPPYARHEGRFPDLSLRRPDYAVDDYRDRSRFERPPPLEWSHRDRVRDNILNERKGYERRALSPPPVAPPPRGHWARGIRERSRSPIRGGAPLKDYRRDMYMERGRDDRRGMGRAAY
ncbi:OLC1v1037340C2 [Oldenlandia corymbosa var. corymbosa]|uniref:OLC1v1037340C2 n=1 Tax=Oldenlandia corymbosa var. corymbosa TaxID=529605 RepID=A0AAV1CXI2_OLDCO|nr:OLC1v1037340C2 [Oldenlandia corymbosa var. corymbosa]